MLLPQNDKHNNFMIDVMTNDYNTTIDKYYSHYYKLKELLENNFSDFTFSSEVAMVCLT